MKTQLIRSLLVLTVLVAGVSDAGAQPAQSTDTVYLTQTQVIDGGLVRVLSWYDNEWGFSNRMLDTAAAMGRFG